MNSQDFEAVMKCTLARCTEVLAVKAGEYSTDDRLHNFGRRRSCRVLRRGRPWSA